MARSTKALFFLPFPAHSSLWTHPEKRSVSWVNSVLRQFLPHGPTAVDAPRKNLVYQRWHTVYTPLTSCSHLVHKDMITDSLEVCTRCKGKNPIRLRPYQPLRSYLDAAVVQVSKAVSMPCLYISLFHLPPTASWLSSPCLTCCRW